MNLTYDIKTVIEAFGGTNKMADLCQIKPPSVSEWLANGKIPAARVLFLNEKRPDLFRRAIPP